MPVLRTSKRPPLRLPGHSLIQLDVLELDDSDLAKVVGGALTIGDRGGGLGACATTSDSFRWVSCFAAGTLVATEEGPVPVEAFAPLSRAPLLLRPAGSPVRIATGAAGPEAAPIFDLELMTGHRISVSEHHPFPVRVRGEAPGAIRTVPALSLKAGDELQALDSRTNELAWTPIASLTRRRYDGFVYNFCVVAPETPEDHRILANGIVTGDLLYQLHLVEAIRVDAARRVAMGAAIGPIAQELNVSEIVLDEWRRAYESAPRTLYGETRVARALMRAAAAV